MFKRSLFVVMIVLSAVMLVAPGCRRTKAKTTGEGPLNPSELGGQTPPVLPDRPEVGEFGERIMVGQFENVLFDYDSFQVKDAESAKIQKVADCVKGDGKIVVVTEGHCDERGSREYNLTLGEQRALAVRAYLIGLGVNGERIHTRTYGKEKPANPGHDEAAWRANRRVEFALYRPK